jgi:hypothetical protein
MPVRCLDIRPSEQLLKLPDPLLRAPAILIPAHTREPGLRPERPRGPGQARKLTTADRWDYTVAELRQIAAEHSLTATSRMTHDELVSLIAAAGISLYPNRQSACHRSGAKEDRNGPSVGPRQPSEQSTFSGPAFGRLEPSL